MNIQKWLRWPLWSRVSPVFWFKWHWEHGDFSPGGAAAYWRTNTLLVRVLIIGCAIEFAGLLVEVVWFQGSQN